MRRISSNATFLYKRIFPITWFGFLAVFVVVTAVAALRGGGPGHVMTLAVAVVMMAIGYFIMKKLMFDLVDEVWDDGNSLVVRNGGQEERIALSDISNVSYSAMVNPPRVTLSLRRPGVFGPQVTFCGPIRFVPFTTSPTIVELIQRIDAQRRG